jgi:hypothetical protein
VILETACPFVLGSWNAELFAAIIGVFVSEWAG